MYVHCSKTRKEKEKDFHNEIKLKSAFLFELSAWQTPQTRQSRLAMHLNKVWKKGKYNMNEVQEKQELVMTKES